MHENNPHHSTLLSWTSSPATRTTDLRTLRSCDGLDPMLLSSPRARYARRRAVYAQSLSHLRCSYRGTEQVHGSNQWPGTHSSFRTLSNVRRSRAIFLSSCNAGLPRQDTNGRVLVISAAERLARESGVDVIAPLGNLSSNVYKGRIVFSVRNEDTNRVLGANEAFVRFSPDGTQRVLSFGEMIEALVPAHEHGNVNYGFNQ